MIQQCIIDALLERTIKHMLFLQSVTKHADKLKQTGESKVKTSFTFFCLVSQITDLVMRWILFSLDVIRIRKYI